MRRIAERRGATIARKALLARKNRISGVAASLRKGAGESSPADLESQDVFERLQLVETRELADIEAALRRVDDGTYGDCQRCGGQIGVLRLRAVPEARLCMGCSGK